MIIISIFLLSRSLQSWVREVIVVWSFNALCDISISKGFIQRRLILSRIIQLVTSIQWKIYRSAIQKFRISFAIFMQWHFLKHHLFIVNYKNIRSLLFDVNFATTSISIQKWLFHSFRSSIEIIYTILKLIYSEVFLISCIHGIKVTFSNTLAFVQCKYSLYEYIFDAKWRQSQR